jgi:signal transduction histidine kinase
MARRMSDSAIMASLTNCVHRTLVVVLLMATFPCAAALAAEAKRVMVLYYSFGGNLVNAKNFRVELDRQSRDLLEVYDAPFLTARPADEIAPSRYADYLRALLPDQRLDLAVAIGGSAVRLFQKYRSQHFPSTPMLVIAEERRVPAGLGANDVVVATSINLAEIVENILRVRPETTNVAVVIGNSPNERVWLEEMRTTFQPYTTRVSFTYFNDLPFDEMLNRAANLPPHSAIFLLLLLTDAAGATHEEVKVLSRLHSVANAPIFSYYDANFGNGIVGGPLISVQERGRISAQVALRIVGGGTPADIKIPPIGFARPKFDWREMQHWSISERRLPPGSEIHFRDPSVWEQYRAQTLAISAALLLQAALISWLIYEHRRRHLAEVSSRNSMAELAYMNRRAAAGELSAAIAHEVSQPLTGIVARASAARRWLARERPDTDKVRTALDEIEAAGHRASDILKNVRSLFNKDTEEKSQVDVNRLIESILELTRIDLRKHQVDLQSEIDDRLPLVSGNPVQLQQVILNLILNAIEAMRSVQPRVLTIESKLNENDNVQVSVEDTGIGITSSNRDQIFKPLFTTKGHGMGMGLSICRSIIEAHHGRIWVTPGSKGGTAFHFELPRKDG